MSSRNTSDDQSAFALGVGIVIACVYMHNQHPFFAACLIIVSAVAWMALGIGIVELLRSHIATKKLIESNRGMREALDDAIKNHPELKAPRMRGAAIMTIKNGVGQAYKANEDHIEWLRSNKNVMKCFLAAMLALVMWLIGIKVITLVILVTLIAEVMTYDLAVKSKHVLISSLITLDEIKAFFDELALREEQT